MELSVPSPSRTLPLLMRVWLKTTKPPGVTWPLLLTVKERLRTVFTINASCSESVAAEVGEVARK